MVAEERHLGQAGARHVPRGAELGVAPRRRGHGLLVSSLDGGFAYVVGVDRAGQREALREHGATVVVDDLADLL